jgi:hypothetical protein
MIGVRAEEAMEKSGHCEGEELRLLSLYLLRYALFGLLDTYFLRRVTHS